MWVVQYTTAGQCLVLKYGEERRDGGISDIWINFSIFYWVSLSHESIDSTRENRVQRKSRMQFHTMNVCESQCKFNGCHWIESHSQYRHCFRASSILDDAQLSCTLFTHRCSDFYWKIFQNLNFKRITDSWIFHEVNILLLVEFVIAKSLNSVSSWPLRILLDNLISLIRTTPTHYISSVGLFPCGVFRTVLSIS